MRVTLYSKSDCHLCDAFHFELLDLQSELGFAYEQRYVQEDAPLFAEFSGHFPLVDVETSATEPTRLIDLTSQRHLRAEIRQAAGLAALMQAT